MPASLSTAIREIDLKDFETVITDYFSCGKTQIIGIFI
jgi:hypothetical protein